MPTNKLWLEHTEHAAWQSVDALREKLALAEQRQARLAPPVEGWQQLLDGLDRAKSEHGVAGDSYAAVLRALLERLTQVAELAQSAARAEPRLVEQGPSVVEIERQTQRSARRGRTASFDDEEPAGEPPVHGEARLFREIRARYQELLRGRGREGASGVLSDIEARLGDLPDLDPGELSDVAADLAALALVLTRGSADE